MTLHGFYTGLIEYRSVTAFLLPGLPRPGSVAKSVAPFSPTLPNFRSRNDLLALTAPERVANQATKPADVHPSGGGSVDAVTQSRIKS